MDLHPQGPVPRAARCRLRISRGGARASEVETRPSLVDLLEPAPGFRVMAWDHERPRLASECLDL